MLARKCLALASELDHNLMSTGGVSGVKMNLSTPTTESGGGSPSNFFALHCLQFGTDGSMCDSDGTLA
jgi:hypothetical protein